MSERPATPAELREKARHYREMIPTVYDQQLADALATVAEEYEKLADWLERGVD